MTPLLGTKNSSAPVGDKSGGDRRAARSLLPCAAWGGYGAAWATRAAASLFTIVRHSSAKNIVLVQCPLYVHTGNGACKVFTKHETRITAFMLFTKHEIRPFPAKPQTQAAVEQRPYHPRGFWGHETRNTNHGFFSPWVCKGRTIRNPRPDRRARRPVTAFLRVVVRHRASMARHGRPSSPAPATRPVGFSPATKHETRFSPSLWPLQGEQPQARPTGFTNHETRDTNHGLYAFHESRDTKHGMYRRSVRHGSESVTSRKTSARPPFPCARSRGLARYRAAMARHGRPSSPAPATRPVGFSPATRHEARNMVFPRPCGHSKESNPKPDQQAFTNHETRDTNHGFFSSTKHETRITAFMLPYPPFPTFSHDFPAFPGNIRPPPPQPIKGSPAVHRSGWAAGRAPCVGNPTKMHKIPDPTGKCAKHSVRRSSCRHARAAAAAANPE